MRLALLLLISLAFLPSAFAQETGTLEGIVVDEHGDPLPGANVILEGTQLGAATDLEGNYRVIGIPLGQYTITAHFVGFEPSSQEVQIDSGITSARYFGLVENAWEDYCGCECETWGCDYGPPLVPTDPFAPRVISGRDMERLPVGR